MITFFVQQEKICLWFLSLTISKKDIVAKLKEDKE